MTNKLINSDLGAVFSTDPAVALWTYIKSIWTTTTGYTVPASSAIKFDTKFGEMKGFFFYFIVENMPSSIKPQILGGSRYSVEEVKRIQILCIGKSAKDTKWKMEQHILSLLNSNLTGMTATYGIKVMNISEFQEIPTSETDDKITGLQPNTGFHKARSFATVRLRYELESTTA
ncbi:hypothetical protein [Nitrososphaeria virus YSH_922147]|uniref:Uncharacterized protein n=1 Tax=Nitrososphaeria virus YSH_922147 TaxID=3071323 RepID=A0A976YF92_9CAUD|nr:hypothetical protein QKV94_gp33 [Yangshan Harbor Nitrososphaeria virus]UVF62442.1 hypothetical protein [Nitrososphaeria virus YSH_922147]